MTDSTVNPEANTSADEGGGHNESELLATPLHALHVELGARMVPFAGYDMPIQFSGVVSEHTHTRTRASLFDVAHMGVIEFGGDVEAVGAFLETLLPSALKTLKPGRQRYSFLTNSRGGIIDDLMVSRSETGYSMVVNASRKHIDLAHLRSNTDTIEVTSRSDLALIALQGPEASRVLSEVVDMGGDADAIETMDFMSSCAVLIGGTECAVSRSGYTGEDGYELTIASEAVESVARALLCHDVVEPAGLGARDTLRLEAGLCLYGNDLDEDTTPVEAGLVWAMQKRRRAEGGFPGAEVIQAQLEKGPERVRVGISASGRRPVREQCELRDIGARSVGMVSSGGFGPTVERPVAMGYVPPALSAPGTELIADVRGKQVPVVVAALPFVAHAYYRG